MKFNKKLSLSLLSILAVGFTVSGISALNDAGALTVKADNAEMTVDTLGNLEWEKVEGVTEYSWNYTIGQTTSKNYRSQDNKVNVGLAIVEAAQAAKAAAQSSASLIFNVTPIGVDSATTATWTYEFDKYINFGYSTHDISSVNAECALGEVSIEDTLSDTTSDNRWTTSAVYKNDLLTIGLKADVELTNYGVSFYLFNDRKSVGDSALVKNTNYRIRLLKNGLMSINNKGDAFGAAGDAATTNNKALTLGEKYYVAMGVFDTYAISGEVVGETVYCARSAYDQTTDSLMTVSNLSHFYTQTEVETAGITYEYTPVEKAAAKDVDGNLISIERSALVVKVHGTIDKNGDGTAETKDNYVYISSGMPTYKKLAVPSAVYYDNTDETINWNKVDGADGYEWRVGNEQWEKVSANKISVSSLLAKYKKYGYLPISLRAVNPDSKSAEVEYNVNLKTFYKTQSVKKDLTELYAFTDSTLNAYSQNSGNGATAGGKMFDTPDLALNTHVTFAFITNEQTPKSERFVLLRLLRDSSNMYSGQYSLALWGDGTLFLTPNWNGTTSIDTSDMQSNMAGNFRVSKVTNGFKAGVKYYVTFGIDEVYEEETKLANRITVRVEEETENGLSRNTIGVISYDFKYFDKWEEEKKIQLGAHSDVVSLWQSQNTSVESDVMVLAKDEVVATQALKYGEWYDFSKEMSAVSLDGYTIDGWTYKEGDKSVEFPTFGWWNKNVDGKGFLIEAAVAPIKYNVSYNLPNGATTTNSSEYTIESDWTLSAPANLPEGKLFAGWYEVSDAGFTTPIITLKGKTGNIELVARLIDGYTISVDGETFIWKEGDDAFVLTAPELFGKTFLKWQVLSGTEYVDYTGETTFRPTGSMSFKAVYDWTTYSITYVAESATHQNATSYTIEMPVTFEKATKEGYFFLGWYKEASFATKLETTQGYAENLTVYAKFEKITLPTALTFGTSGVAQALPIPQLPDGSNYEVALYKGTDKLQITDNGYTFATQGEYVLTYVITLPTGENVEHNVALTVKQVYSVTLHYGEGETLTLKKYAGEKIAETELPATKEGYEFVGVYTDAQYKNVYELNSAVEGDLQLYIQWAEKKNGQGNTSGGCSGSFAGSGVIIAALGLCTAILLKRKER